MCAIGPFWKIWWVFDCSAAGTLVASLRRRAIQVFLVLMSVTPGMLPPVAVLFFGMCQGLPPLLLPDPPSAIQTLPVYSASPIGDYASVVSTPSG